MKRKPRASGIVLILLLPVLACSRKAATLKPTVPPPEASYELRLGKGIYNHYCQTCHGETGAGDGFNAFNLDPRPQDLSDPALQKKKSDADFGDAIRRGGAGVGLSPLMPPWGHTLSSQQIDEVVLYLRTLGKRTGPQQSSDGSMGSPSPPAGP